ncbi:type I-E CRISPR-associated protein Cas6/Cse3/CasE [Quadrisphaera sp. DSM 44207]|uniref:type I-E CRISPR-associated protein Cas6/Cse3/CasE n=1 Tax=Quadrisphaera sp. DSM 44207 TaxID=1881057 RepID=UPI0008902921|nr:type I-E CRISPR-associated protein Cas6/Cse3/CasE [Quadrisphaera sp. DSM 44207]SDQ52500.1 CRISPR-associated protein, Cse3 family [Quadrisphaera sp. DSM 44207]
MYLTRFAINPARRGSWTLLASPQAMHAAVLAAFPPGAASGAAQDGRVLWRVDRGEQHRADLYLASPTQPDLTHLVEQAGWPATQTWQTRDYRPLLYRVQAGQRWVFRLTANPVHSARVRDGEDTKPLAHVTAAQQQQWLIDRTERLGFHVAAGARGEPGVVVRDRRTARFTRQGKTVTVAMATFDGVLEVLDPDALRTALVRGVGRAKGYGCGLLTLAPVP